MNTTKVLVTTAKRRTSMSDRRDALVSLSFKVPLDFRMRFKVYATQQGISMNELLCRAFERVMQQQLLPMGRSEDSVQKLWLRALGLLRQSLRDM